MPGRARRPAAADDPSSCGRRGVVADPGAGPCGGVAGAGARASAGAAAARHLVARLGAAACGAGAGCQRWSAELPFWRGMLERAVAAAGRTARSIRRATSTARRGHLTLTLPAAVTGALLTRVPAAFHGGINDVLLTGLALAVADWRRRQRGCRRHRRMRCCSTLEGHGREEVFAGRRPVAHGGLVHQPVIRCGSISARVDLDGGAGGRRCARPCAQADQGAAAGGAGQRARLRAAALSEPETAAELAALPAPQLGFNYLGRFAAAVRRRADWSAWPMASELAAWRRRSGDAAGAR